MNMNRLLGAILLICAAFVMAGLLAARQISEPQNKQPSPLSGRVIAIDIQDSDLCTFINESAKALGIMPIIIDGDIQGTVHIAGLIPVMAKEDAFSLFIMVLKNNNAMLAKDKGIYLVLPITMAIRRAIPIIEKLPDEFTNPNDLFLFRTIQGGDGRTAGTASASAKNIPRLDTSIVQVKFVPLKEMIEVIKLFMTDGGFIRPYERMNLLILTDHANSTARILQIIPSLDSMPKTEDLAKIKALLKENPKLVSSKDDFGYTLLYRAVGAGRKDIAELLLSKGADVNAKANNGMTPLHLLAAALRHEYDKGVVELLLAKGADVNARDKDGKTPLHLAAEACHKDVAELLLANKAEVDAKDNTGKTPLHLLATAWSFQRHEDYKGVVELLLAKGADVNVRDKDGKTPMKMAEQRGNKDIAELLHQHGGYE